MIAGVASWCMRLSGRVATELVPLFPNNFFFFFFLLFSPFLCTACSSYPDPVPPLSVDNTARGRHSRAVSDTAPADGARTREEKREERLAAVMDEFNQHVCSNPSL